MVIPIIVIVIVVICIVVVAMYNNLVSLRQRVQNAWSQIDVKLKRRFDLIPNLLNLELLGLLLLQLQKKLIFLIS